MQFAFIPLESELRIKINFWDHLHQSLRVFLQTSPSGIQSLRLHDRSQQAIGILESAAGKNFVRRLLKLCSSGSFTPLCIRQTFIHIRHKSITRLIVHIVESSDSDFQDHNQGYVLFDWQKHPTTTSINYSQHVLIIKIAKRFENNFFALPRQSAASGRECVREFASSPAVNESKRILTHKEITH